MWPDNETERDFLNFSGVAETVAEIIVQAKGRPISIGVSGAWGIGKSSMIKLTRSAIAARRDESGKKAADKYVFVEFNAWLYQGYDDARAALMDVIADKLAKEAHGRQTALDKVASLAKRVKWLRAAKLAATSAASIYFGVPPVGAVGEIFELAKKVWSEGVGKETGEAAKKAAADAVQQGGELLNPKEETSPPKEIQALRDAFEQALEELGITLVVLIDDLDRCLPETTISTLEAIRLFLFLKNTAFVIAADNDMIKHAVRKHFVGVSDDLLVTNYFDKLIQVPIRVPQLGTQEVRAYMMLLFVDNSELSDDDKEKIRAGMIGQLKRTWQGKKVDRAFVQSLGVKLPEHLVGQFDTAERLASLMTTATGILGNPRLIKRFLNALSIRMTISKAQGVGVDEAVLAKLLLFERIGDTAAYAELVKNVSASDEGKPTFLQEWEDAATAGRDLDLKAPWNAPFVKEWLALSPALHDHDLRGALYVGREQAPLITPEDRLSSDGAELLAAMIEHPEMSGRLKDRLVRVPRMETTVMMDRLLERARKEQEWGAPPILTACIALADADPIQGPRLAAFIAARPHQQIQPSIVPKIGDRPWAASLLDGWLLSGDIARPVKTAISKTRPNGNVAV
ncbi:MULTISPECIES: KAP family P-loop NTPase fold protein [unclassified Bradyrhizobium]|uniref:KAP family P-loop NTPase fold protein n=1 Tax=unclassified Bradyrhizobium TaxID=2631580 RepID=UPI00211E79EE|nr:MULTISPECIES: P-loop NTPase fold protein [unclassified Bradyrhizobium]MDD1534005.1 ATPase [Bradyrhizobium sp. WBOS8]MDD1583725.1 ATPase [Bradyrhizobium sp. WBOS4]UUO48943.1 ATPase [Bradyrhizobium sp. WBOS04]UUO62761.1 ATPase [Bradyrhizobium sp. WBOS08]